MKDWRPVKEPHPLIALAKGDLEGLTMAPFIGPKNRFGAQYFQIFLKNEEGDLSTEPFIEGLYNQGPFPAHHWIEIGYFSGKVTFSGKKGRKRVNLKEGETLLLVFQSLVDLLPPGGHLMVEYESSTWRTTERALEQGVPPAATPLGRLMLYAGCNAGFKNWYFSEGWSEGPRKLQGFKALDRDHARSKLLETVAELLELISKPISGGELQREGRRIAVEVVQRMHDEIQVWPGELEQRFRFLRLG